MRGVCWVAVLCACGPAGTLGGDLVGDESTGRTVTEQRSTNEQKPTGCTTPSLAAIRSEIFVERCGDCHGGESPAESLDLTLPEPDLRTRLASAASQSPSGMPLITPSSIGGSYLFLKVAVTTPLIGDRMPKDADPVSECLQDTLRAWIESGAEL